MGKVALSNTIKIPVKTDLNKLRQANDLVKRLMTSVDKLNRPLDNSNSALNKLADNATHSGKVYRDAVDKMKQSTNDFAKDVRVLNKTQRNNITANDSYIRSADKVRAANEKVSTSVNKQTGKFDEAARSSEKTKRSFGGLYNAGSRLSNMAVGISAAMLPVAAAFAKSADEATRLQNKYTTIKNLLNTGGESAGEARKETNAMQRENNQFALQYGVSPEDMAKGGEELVRRGYSGKQELASHRSFLQASRASGDDYNSVVGYGAPVLEQFGYKTKAGDSTSRMRKYTKMVLNQMAYGADLTATDFTGMGNALRYAGATAHSANQTLAGTVAGIGVLSNNGQDGSVAGTGLRKAINAFASPSTSAKSQQGQALQDLGLNPKSFQNADGSLKTLKQDFDLLNRVTSKDSESQKFNLFHKFFGTTGQESALILSKNTKQLGSLTNQVGKATKKNYIGNLAKKNMASWQNQIKVFQQHLNVMGLEFTKTVLPAFTKVLKFTNGILSAFIKLPQSVKTTTGFVVGISSALGAAVISSKVLKRTLGWLWQGGGGNGRGGGTSAVDDIADIAGSLPTGGKGDTRMSRLEASRASTRMGRLRGGRLGKLTGLFGAGTRSTAEVGEREALRLAQRGTASKLLGGVKAVGSRIPWLDVAMSATSLIGINKKNAGGKIGNFGGMLAGMEGGAALGSLLGPIGTLIGGGVGAAGGAFAGTKVGKYVQKNAGKAFSTRMTKDQRKRSGGHAAKTEMVVGPMGVTPIAYSPSTGVPQKPKHSGLSKTQKVETSSVTRTIRAANENWAGRSNNRVNSKTYKTLSKDLTAYSNKQTKASKNSVKLLEHEGVISKSQAKKMMSNDSKTWDKRLSNAKKGVNNLANSEKKGGANRESAVKNAESSIAKLVASGSSRQKIILGKLKDSTSKLSVKQAENVISSSYKAMHGQISNANKAYKKSKQSAESKYKSVIKAADHERYVTGSISKKQYEKIKDHAEKQRDSTIDAAKTAKNKAIDHATEMHRKVVAQTKQMANGNLNNMNAWTGSAESIWSKFGNWWNTFWGGLSKLGDTGANAIAHNLTPVIKKQNAQLNKLGQKKSKYNKYISKVEKKKPKTSNFPGMAPVFSAHANGSTVTSSHSALVGENGVELAYRLHGNQARLLGARGAAIERVHSGERILNARDTKAVLSGGLGSSLPGYVNGTHTLSGEKVKTGIEGTKKKYDKELKGSQRAVSTFKKSSKSDFGNIKSDTTDKVSDTTASVLKKYKWLKSNLSNTTDDISKDWRSSWKSLVNYFGDVFDKLQPYAHKGMAGAISSLNGGFTGIDSALAQFGGNKQVLKPIHYARGSHGPIASDRMAVLNDAKSGPRQELVVRHDQLLRPHGHDVLTPLQKGDEVLNGSQVEQIKPYLPHFAKGTGVSKSKLRKIAKANAKRPAKAYNDEFATNVKPSGSALQIGIGGTSKAAAKSVGPKWSDAMWGYIQDTIQSGGSAAGGSWRHDPGEAKTNGFGAKRAFGSHDGVDFSGPQGTPIKAVHGGVVTRAGKPVWDFKDLGYVVTVKSDDGWQEIYQEFGGANHIKAHVGQVIKTGDTVATQGGIIGSSTGPHVHIGVSKGSLWDHGGSSTRGWYDVTKMHGTDNGSSKLKSSKSRTNSTLAKLVKRQLGKSAISWIKKNLQESDANVGSLSGSMAHRAKTLAAAIKDMYPSATDAGIAAVLGNWEFESRLDPNAINPGGGASGLGQWLGGRKSNLIAYAKRKGKNWKDAGTQLSFALNGDGSDSSVLKSVLRGKGSVSSLANKFSSQWERGGYNAQHVAGARKVEAALHNNGGWSKSGKLNIFGEKDAEVAINPKRNSADGLIVSAIKARAASDRQSVFGRMFDSMKMAKERKGLRDGLNRVQSQGSANRPSVVINVNPTINITGSVSDEQAKESTSKLMSLVDEAINKKFRNTAIANELA